MQQKNIKNKLSWTQFKRDIETKIYHIRYNWKSILVKITILFFESIAILIYNFNLGNISWLNKVNSKFQILALNKLVGFEVNFIYYLVYVLTLVPIAITIRLSFKPVSYTENDEKMELVFKPENKEENKSLIPPSFIVKYPNKEDADTTIFMFYKNSYTKKEIDAKWEPIRNHFGLYVKYTEDFKTDKILIYMSKTNPLYPKIITFNDKCLNNLLKANIEEAADIFDKDFSTYPKETKEQKDTLEREKLIHAKIIYYIEQLIRKSGATAIHVILNSQKLTRTNLPKSLPTNITENWSA